jgi:hypothetical protein
MQDQKLQKPDDKHCVENEIVAVPHFDIPVSSRSEWRDKFKFKFIEKPEGTELILRELANELCCVDSRATKLFSKKTVEEEIVPNMRALANLVIKITKNDGDNVYKDPREIWIKAATRPVLTRFLIVIVNLKGLIPVFNFVLKLM